jgi:O-antigen ligase
MRSEGEGRAVDFMIAGSLAVFPLLPTGPTYFGLSWPWALEAFLLSVVAVGLVLVATQRSGVRAASSSHPGGAESVRLVRRGYLVWLVPVAAATVVGLLEKNPLDGVLLRVETNDLFGRLARPMDQAADPFYPLRVGLTYLEGGLVFWLLSAVLTRTRRPWRRIRSALDGCVLGVALVSIIAIIQYATRANLLTYWVRANPGLTRTNATLDDPNALASFLVLGIGLAAGVAWSTRGGGAGWRRQLSATVTTALASGALVTTVSRAGWAALMLAAVVFATTAPERLFARRAVARAIRLVGRSAAVLLIGAVLLWAIALAATPKREASLPATPWQAAVQTVDPRESLEAVLKGRLLLWRAALERARADWPLGGGLGSFPGFAATYPGSAGPENAHNYFLQVLAEGGVLGLAGLGVLLATIALAVGHRSRERGRRRGRLALGLSVGLSAFVLTWLTGHPMLTLSNQLWFGCVLAVGLAAIEPTRTAAPANARDSVLVTWALGRAWVPSVVAVTLIVLVPRAFAEAHAGSLVSHAAGVYAWEQIPASGSAQGETRFRWTKGSAAFREPVRGTVLTVPLSVSRPDLATQRVELRVAIEGVPTAPVTLLRNGWQTLTYDLVALLGEGQLRAHRTITVTFVVNPTFVPARVGSSDDWRELGVGVGTFRWSGPTPEIAAAGRGPS